MPVRSRFRVLFALTLAVSSLVAVSAPAAAETIFYPCSGNCGDYQLTDSSDGGKGAICSYETGSYDLNWISIRPPLMHGPFAYNTRVLWRYKILRAPVSSSVFNGIYTSSWQSALANDQIPAYGGQRFSRRTWYAPEDPHGKFLVRINMRWNNSSGNLIGVVRAEYDWYSARWNGNSYVQENYCLEDY